MLKSTLTAQLYKFYLNSNEEEAILTLQGNSMSPTLKEGWKVKLKPFDAKEINCGDVAVFSHIELICHRIIGKFRWNKKLYFIQIGDSFKLGKVFDEQDLVGKVVEVTDAEGNKIDEKIWRNPSLSSFRIKLLGYVYLPLFLTKRAIFGKKQNRFIGWIRKIFWKTYLKDR